MDGQGRVFVGDAYRIQIFDGDGQVLGQIGMDGVPGQVRFNSQNKLAVSLGNHVIRLVIKK